MSSWVLRLEPLISTGTAVHSAFDMTFPFHSQLLARKEKVCSGWEIFLDSDLMPAQDNLEVMSVTRTLLCLIVSIHSLISNAQNSCFRLLTISPISRFVPGFYAFACATVATWSAPHLSRKIPMHAFCTSSSLSVRSFLWRMGRQELASSLGLTGNEPLQIVYLLLPPPQMIACRESKLM